MYRRQLGKAKLEDTIKNLVDGRFKPTKLVTPNKKDKMNARGVLKLLVDIQNKDDQNGQET